MGYQHIIVMEFEREEALKKYAGYAGPEAVVRRLRPCLRERRKWADTRMNSLSSMVNRP